MLELETQEKEPTMRDPISETAHYVTLARDGEPELALVQQGRLAESGWVRVTWTASAHERRGARPGVLRSALAWLGGLV